MAVILSVVEYKSQKFSCSGKFTKIDLSNSSYSHKDDLVFRSQSVKFYNFKSFHRRKFAKGENLDVIYSMVIVTSLHARINTTIFYVIIDNYYKSI